MLRTRKSAQVSIMQEATSRKFDGGLNVADSELNLSSKYARELENMLIGLDGSLQIRQGCRLFCDLAVFDTHHVTGLAYFAGYIIAMTHNSEIFAIDGQGTATKIWSAEIAAAKRPGLTIWAHTHSMTFVEFNGELLISNGADKPLVITTSLLVDYLADPATGSNINVPVGYLMEKFSNHVVIAVGSTIHVSERNAAGAWQGDAGTQFVNNFDMKTYVTSGDTTITGLLAFKGFLLVMFQECTIPVQFVEDATATPKLALVAPPDSIIASYGAISPKAQQDIGDSALSCDIVGVTSISLSRFTKILAPDRPSRFIDPILQRELSRLPVSALHDDSFSIYHRKLSMYMLFLPNDHEPYQTKSTAYCYRYIERLKLEAWTKFTGWNWHCGARSSEGNIFFARENDTAIFVLGDAEQNALHADFIGEQETFSDGTTFTDQTGFSPIADYYQSGIPIKWVWELPWSDLKHRGLAKTLRYIILDTEGGAEIRCRVFIDDMYVQNDPGEEFSDGTTYDDDMGHTPRAEPLYTYALQSDYVAKDHGGYGTEPYGADVYGGGNNTAVRKLTLTPTKFNTFKLRFEGESVRPLKFVAITLLYQGGTIRRLPL